MGRIKHSHSYTPEYRVWINMKSRCNNPLHPTYIDYGGRGIKVSIEWNSFETFLLDMGFRPDPTFSIERKNNNKGYSKDNCIWASKKQQSMNRRCSPIFEYMGETKHITEWAKQFGFKKHTIWCRLFTYEWTIHKALTTPTRDVYYTAGRGY